MDGTQESEKSSNPWAGREWRPKFRRKKRGRRGVKRGEDFDLSPLLTPRARRFTARTDDWATKGVCLRPLTIRIAALAAGVLPALYIIFSSLLLFPSI